MGKYRFALWVVFISLSSAMMAQQRINMTVGKTTFSVVLENNRATESLLHHLQQGDVTVETSRYGGFEQVGAMSWSLPADDTRLTTSPGDVILYNDRQLVVFFGSNSWSYTRLGRIEHASTSELKSALDVPSCHITLSLPKTTKAGSIYREKRARGNIHDLLGRPVAKPVRGIYVVDGKKVMQR